MITDFDAFQMLSIIQSTKVLLAARKHMLFAHLGEGSSAPLVRENPVTDDCLAALIQSNMGLFNAYSYFFPETIEVYVSIARSVLLLALLPLFADCLIDARPSRRGSEFPERHTI